MASTSSSSDNVVNDSVNGSILSDDLLLNILFRLGVKYLFRFKCVSRAWNRLISGAFARTKLSVTMSGLFFHAYVHPYEVQSKHRYAPFIGGKDGMDTNLGFLPNELQLRILDCCNGLLLCNSHSNDELEDEAEGEMQHIKYYVCNPATKRWAALPLPPFKEGYLENATLIFNPRVSPHYKVVRFLDQFDRDPTCLELDVYSSETGAWVQCNVVHGPEIPSLRNQIQTAFLDGTLFALTYPFHMAGFVIEEEGSCQLIQMPVATIEERPVERLGVSEGRLHYAYHDGSQIRIWMRRTGDGADAGEWELRHSTTVQALMLNPLFVKDGYDPVICPFYLPRFPCRFVPLAFHPDAGIVFLTIQGKILAYHLKSKRLKEICDISYECVYLHWLWVYPFAPCLLDFFGGEAPQIS
ncbi:hypothetical protein ACLOJK_019761 [Asimina triloba]